MDVVRVGIHSFFKNPEPHAFAHIHCTLVSDFKVIRNNFMKWIPICYSGYLHFHIMYAVPPCKHNANEHYFQQNTTPYTLLTSGI